MEANNKFCHQQNTPVISVQKDRTKVWCYIYTRLVWTENRFWRWLIWKTCSLGSCLWAQVWSSWPNSKKTPALLYCFNRHCSQKQHIWKNSISRNNFINFSDEVKDNILGRQKGKKSFQKLERKNKEVGQNKISFFNCTGLIYRTRMDHQSTKKIMLIFSRLNVVFGEHNWLQDFFLFLILSPVSVSSKAVKFFDFQWG